MSATNPTTTAEYIQRFKLDTELAHQFTKGDDTLDVVGDEGTYPSLAKLAKNAQTLVATAISELQGLVILKFDFSAGLELNVEHGKDCMFYDATLINSDGAELVVNHHAVDKDNIRFYFTEPEEGVLLLKLYTAL